MADSCPLPVRLVQISQRVGDNYYLPYSVGLLQAYALRHLRQPGRFAFLPPLYRRMSLADGLSAFAGVAVAGFSVYVWNVRRSLLIAAGLRERQPGTLIVFGGPQVPDQAEAFLRAHPFIDLCTHGAGEAVFTAILDRYAELGAPGEAADSPLALDWHGIDGISWIDAEGDFRHQPPAPRSRDLSGFPSPFLTGVFDPLLAEHPDWHTPFETNRGCPFSCSFCDWGSATAAKVVSFPQERLWAELAWFGAHRIKSVLCADANFGILTRDPDIAREVARVRRETGFPLAFQIQTAKNVTGRVVEIERELTRAGLSATAAISLQSLDAGTLRSIRRQNISLEAYRRMQRECLEHGIYSYTDLIMGLPGETFDSFVSGIETVMEHGQFNRIYFHDATLLPNAAMAQPDYRREFALESVEICVPAHTVPPDGVPELMEIVVATRDMDREDWVRVHVYAWTSSFLFYTHKLLQLVMMVLHETLPCRFSELISLFALGDLRAYPLLQRVQDSFITSARQQQKGYPESQLNSLDLSPVEGTHLTPDLSMQLQIGSEGLFEPFYREAEALLTDFARQRRPDISPDLLHEAFRVNRRYFIHAYRLAGFPLAGVPAGPERLSLCYNLPEYFRERLQGRDGGLCHREPVSLTM